MCEYLKKQFETIYSWKRGLILNTINIPKSYLVPRRIILLNNRIQVIHVSLNNLEMQSSIMTTEIWAF